MDLDAPFLMKKNGTTKAKPWNMSLLKCMWTIHPVTLPFAKLISVHILIDLFDAINEKYPNSMKMMKVQNKRLYFMSGTTLIIHHQNTNQPHHLKPLAWHWVVAYEAALEFTERFESPPLQKGRCASGVSKQPHARLNGTLTHWDSKTLVYIPFYWL